MDEYFIQQKLDVFPNKSSCNLDSKICIEICVQILDYSSNINHYLNLYQDIYKKAIIEYDDLYYTIGDGYSSIRQILKEIGLYVEDIHVDEENIKYLDKDIDKINKEKIKIKIILIEYTTK